MKHIKTYEAKSKNRVLVDLTKFNNCGDYIEKTLNLHKENGYIQWVYDTLKDNVYFLTYTFIFMNDTPEHILNELKKFFIKNDIEFKTQIGTIYEQSIEIVTNIKKNKIKEFSDLYTEIKKYNL